MKASKWVLMAAIVLMSALALSGCMNYAPKEPVTSVMPSASMSPGGVANPSVPGGVTGSGPATPFNWVTNAPQVETKINQISEIADSRVVVTGTTALVGVKYTAAYKGETTERIREMVAAAVREADPTIQTVAVSSTEADVNEIFAMADQIRAGTAPDTLVDKINRIVRNPTSLK